MASVFAHGHLVSQVKPLEMILTFVGLRVGHAEMRCPASRQGSGSVFRGWESNLSAVRVSCAWLRPVLGSYIYICTPYIYIYTQLVSYSTPSHPPAACITSPFCLPLGFISSSSFFHVPGTDAPSRVRLHGWHQVCSSSAKCKPAYNVRFRRPKQKRNRPKRK